MIKTLSVCMIVKNEAAFIDAAIKSVGEIADQVVVVDTGSTDGTQEIARSAGAEVFSLPWPGSFAASRNESLSHATGDWILILDADERLHKNSAQSLRYLVNSAPAALIELKIINYMDDLQAQTASEHYSVRLFPNHYGLSFTGRIHEQLVVPHGVEIPRQWCRDITIEHYGYQPSVVKERNKSERNLDLLLQCIADDPENPFHHFNLAQTLSVLGEQDQAISALQQALFLAGGQGPAWEAVAWIQLFALVLTHRGVEAAAPILEQCPEDCKANPDYWIARAQFEAASGNALKAINAFRTAAEYKHLPIMTNSRIDRSSVTWKPYFGIANVYLAMGDLETAYLYLIQALRECPNNPVVKQQYTDLRQLLKPIVGG